MLDDEAVEVSVSENKTRARPPVAEKSVLDIFVADLALDEDVVLEEDHGSRDVVGGTTEAADVIELLLGEDIELEVDFELIEAFG